MIFLGKMLPSQQEKIHAHSFVLGPELRIQYIYTYVKNLSTIDFEFDARTLRFSQELYRNRDEYTYVKNSLGY